MAKARPKPIFMDLPFLVGLFLTILVAVVFFASLLFGEVCNYLQGCVSKWTYLQTAPPNEIGDTLAGFAGTLAFVWLVVTVWLQATELREQRAEFKKMADAQSTQVEILLKQGEIFELEQKQRLEDRARLLLDAYLASVRKYISELQTHDVSVKWLFRFDDFYPIRSGSPKTYNDYAEISNDDEFFEVLHNQLFWRLKLVESGEDERFVGTINQFQIGLILSGFKVMSALHDRLSEDQAVRLDKLCIQDTQKLLEKIATSLSKFQKN